MPVVERKELQSILPFGEKISGSISDLLMNSLNLNAINELYDSASDKSHVAFIDKILELLTIKEQISEEDLSHIPKEGPFIVISNHPFGLLDGLILIKTIASIRPDFQVMGNFMLNRLKRLDEYFIYVDPFTGSKHVNNSFSGVRQMLLKLDKGECVGIFPAGEVSSFQLKRRTVTDKKWDKNAIRLIQKANIPIVPVFFQGKNSALFQMLGAIHPALRTARIPSELFKKKGALINVRIGKAIEPAEWQRFEELHRLSRYLRARVYSLDNGLSVNEFFKNELHKVKDQKTQELIINAVDRSLIARELELLDEECLLHEYKNYQVYCASASSIPASIDEIGRLREVCFRSVGEGTNMSKDIDEYDLIFKHLFIWDTEKLNIVGAYRLGPGKEIIKQYGKKGFYISSLFFFKKEMKPILKNTLELGRAFVHLDYQKKPFPLMLLWKGIAAFLSKNREYEYIMGPVSISDQYGSVSKSLIVDFVKRYYWNKEIASMIKPRKPFKVKLKSFDFAILTQGKGSIKELEKIIVDIEPKGFKLPVLLKKYVRQNAQLVSFNVDPKFNNCLDGLIFCKIKDLPEDINLDFHLRK